MAKQSNHRFWLCTIGALCLLMITGCDRDTGRIVFESNTTGAWEIYQMDPDGSKQTRITNDRGFRTEFAWSLDQTKLAYVSGTYGEKNWNIYYLFVGGSGLVQVTHSGCDHHPSWSPDGNKLVYDACGEKWSEIEIFAVNADGSGRTRLTHNQPDGKWRSWGSAWSPDGNKIAYVREEIGDLVLVNGIFVMDEDGSNQRELVRPIDNETVAAAPIWSPSGDQIAFVTQTEKNLAIYVVNSDGSGLIRLTSEDEFAWAPTWSPSSAHLLYPTDWDRAGEIYLINADGSGKTRLTNNEARDDRPIWSPDGSQIAFMSDRDGEMDIFVMNADGSGAVNLTSENGQVSLLAWLR